MKPTLLILAAGMGSRYGGNKQTDSFGPNGETIIDYSIYDAIRSGFGKIVFVIREEFADNFKKLFDEKLKGKVAVEYVMQDINAQLNGFEIKQERTKPWGTAHAVLCARDVIHEPFAVINADDFYSRDAFEKAYQFLTAEVNPEKYCIIGYQLSKTLSKNGTVSRGVCQVDNENNLESVVERTKIYPEGNQIFYEEGDHKVALPIHTPVSMNFWGFDSNVFEFIQELFKKFLQENGENPKSEFFIPLMGDAFIHDRGGAIKVITTDAQWFGVTYKEDAPEVKENILQLIKAGYYSEDLWN